MSLERLSGTRIEADKAREKIVRSAPKELLERLTPRQRQVVDLLFPSGDQKPLQEVEVAADFHVNIQAVCDVRDRAIEKLERLRKGEPENDARKKNISPPKLEMTPQEKEYILGHSDLSATAISRDLGRSEEIIGRWVR